MIDVGILLLGLVCAAVVLVVVVGRRGTTRTDTAEGLLIEQRRTAEARQVRRHYDATGAAGMSGGAETDTTYKYLH
ncbi:hypothetical protein [Streptomyces sp. NPDC093225]|uniref:hypothetical protein n=1 Tax=Streptomyces sp. NPDC093225 TaxID=3366034 RepID=UPI003823CBA7